MYVVVYLLVLVAHDGHYHLLVLEDQYLLYVLFLLYYQEDPVDLECHLYNDRFAVIASLLHHVKSVITSTVFILKYTLHMYSYVANYLLTVIIMPVAIF